MRTRWRRRWRRGARDWHNACARAPTPTASRCPRTDHTGNCSSISRYLLAHAETSKGLLRKCNVNRNKDGVDRSSQTQFTDIFNNFVRRIALGFASISSLFALLSFNMNNVHNHFYDHSDVLVHRWKLR